MTRLFSNGSGRTAMPYVAATLGCVLLAGACDAQQPVTPVDGPQRIELPEGTVVMECTAARAGAPTVVFENGLGDGRDVWDDVAPSVASVARVCTYDRLGVGESDPVAEGDTRTAFELVATLRATLAQAGVEPPIVLVGHSIAGFILLAYPHLHLDEVSGLVFVDASHPEQWARFSEVDSSFAETGAVLGAERIDRVAAAEELSAVGTFGELPLVVLHQARPTDAPMRPIWVSLQRDHASRSTRSCLVPATESGHHVQNDQPELVIDAVRWVLAPAGSADASPEAFELPCSG